MKTILLLFFCLFLSSQVQPQTAPAIFYEYTTISNGTLMGLSIEVNDLLEQGWETEGAVFISERKYFQMLKRNLVRHIFNP